MLTTKQKLAKGALYVATLGIIVTLGVPGLVYLWAIQKRGV